VRAVGRGDPDAHIRGYHGQDRYRFTLAGCRRGPVRTSTGVVLQAQAGMEALKVADTIVIAGYDDVSKPPLTAPGSAPRRRRMRGPAELDLHRRFALAWAGLLDGRPANTHWRSTA
jgi:AraC family transcriptional activator FtrA